MQMLSELDLAFMPLEAPEFSRNPYAYFAAARAKHPWLARCNFGTIVHEFHAIRDLYGMDEKMRPAFDGIVAAVDATGTPWGRFTEEQMISLPAREHRVLRDTFATKFTPKFAMQMRPVMQAQIKRLLDEYVPKGKFDFEEFASFFPISVMFSLVGAPVEEIAGIRHSLEQLGLAHSMQKERMPEVQVAYLQLENLVIRLIDERRRNPRTGEPEDLMDILIRTGDEGAINERQLLDLIIFLFIAGYDTSKNVMTFTMHTLMQYPEIYARCAKDRDYCTKVVEEALRYFNPGTSTRYAETDLVYRDVLIPKDTFLMFPVNVAGRDPGSFERADVFDPDRKIGANTRHIAFGLGKHMCLGQHIARMQLAEAFHQIAQRMPEPRLAGEYGWRPFPGIWGLQGLPIDIRPAA